MISPKTKNILAWSMTSGLALLMVMSAFLKIGMTDIGIEQATNLGIESITYQFIGIIELVAVILFIIPRTGIVGALLLIAYFGGAIAVHVLQGQSVLIVVGFEIIIWITSALRFPELANRLFAGGVRSLEISKGY